MKKIISSLIFLTFLFPSLSFAGDVYVDGYIRRDGTYVKPHIRSSPDSSRWNNFGPSTNPSQDYNPYSRDWDGDGQANMFDMDDDNDGMLDDYDSSQYGR